MLNALNQLQADYRFDLEIIDIDEHTTLRERFNADVPVLAHGEQIICQHFFHSKAVRDALNG